MVKLKTLFDKYKIKTEDYPKSLLDIETDHDIKHFKKGYKHNGTVIFIGEYMQKDDDYERTFNIRINISLPDDLDYALLEKIEEFKNNHDRSIWESKDELDKVSELLNFECVEYFISSDGLPTLFIAYNIMGGINRHS